MKKFLIFLLFLNYSVFGIELTLNLKKGEAFLYSVKKNQLVVMGNDKTAYRNNTELSLVFKVKVIDSDSKKIKLSFILKKAVLSIVSPLGANKFDTDNVSDYPKNPFLAMLVEMKKTPVFYTFSAKDYSLLESSGFSKIMERVIKKIDIKNKKLKAEILKSLKKKSSEMKDSFKFGFNTFPYLKRKLVENKTFTVKQNLEQQGFTALTTVNYKVEKITEGYVYFSLNSDFSIPDKDVDFNGLKATISVSGKQIGNLTVYRDSGLPDLFSLKQNLKGVFNIKETGEKIPIKVDSVIIIRFKRIN